MANVVVVMQRSKSEEININDRKYPDAVKEKHGQWCSMA
jgi:hypothetical protein